MEVEKFLRPFKPAALCERIDGWRVCWVGGWDRGKIFFVAMVCRPATPSDLHSWSGRTLIFLHVRAIEAQDALEISAEPNIMAINGKQATFT